MTGKWAPSLLSFRRRRWGLTGNQDLEALRRGMRLIYAVAPRYTAATVTLKVLEALLPALTVWLLKRIIDVVATVAGSSPGLSGHIASASTGRIALTLAGLYLLLIAGQQSLSSLSRLLQAHLRDLLAGDVTLRVMEKASAYPDLAPFESPRFYDRLQLLRQEAIWRPMNLFSGFAQVGQASLTLLCMLGFLARFHPGLVALLAATAGPGVFFQRRLHEAVWCEMVDVIPLRRRLADYARVLLTAPFAKEVRLFGFAEYFLGCYRQQFPELIARVFRTRWRMAGLSIALSLLAALGVGGAFAYVIEQALRGRLSLGDLSLYTGALFQASAAASAVVGALAMVHETLPFMRELFAFLDSVPAMSAPPSALPPGPAAIPSCLGTPGRVSPPVGDWSGGRSGFRLNQVAFRYPDTERAIFRSLDLEIPFGQTTAVVGENGAGKSTLVKLLTRLYDPHAGVILLNGIDLREYDLTQLRQQIAVVFQDFAHYQLPVWENIGLGEVRHLRDRSRIRNAARRSGADAVIRRLPRGEETLLGREFEGGVELSGGEWQKIAIARAFMRDAPFLVLDEPTAALDPRSEYEIYRRFMELAAGRTTLLISHRFSTVRMADRILVLEDGAVIEEGDHRGLVARGGRYAELYAMQAERYA